MGIPKDHIIVLSSGNVLEFKDESAKIVGQVPHGGIMVDGLGVGDVGNIVLRDRRLLSESGLIIVVAGIDAASGKIVSGPDIISRGFVYVRENENLISEATKIAQISIGKSLENRSGRGNDWNGLKNGLKDDLRKFMYSKTKRNPVILPIFMEV